MLTAYIRKHFGRYNICSMAILSGLMMLILLLPMLAAGALLRFVMGLSDAWVISLCLLVWVSFSVWIWISFVTIARESKQIDLSLVELTAMQIIVILFAGCQLLFGPVSQQVYVAQMINGSEWLSLGFQAIYFTLAWAAGAKPLLRTYLFFFLILGLAVIDVLR